MIGRARNRRSWLATAAALILLLCGCATARAQVCVGDCDESQTVEINELIRGVNIALGTLALGECKSFDEDGGGKVSVNELTMAVNNALEGCFAPPGSPVIVHGVVLKVGALGAQPSALAGATVRGTIDRDGNGTIEAGEEVSTTTDSDGKYQLQLTAEKGDTLVVGFHEDGVASLYRTIVTGPEGDVALNATLYGFEDLSCDGPRCAVSGSALSIEGLPDDVSGSATLFNPVTDPEAFPGDFSDRDGNLLLSGVFAAVELLDGSGNPLRQLDKPATLRMRMPRDSWSIVQDITPGNGQIDVPLYSFAEVLGTWIREGQGVLEDGNGRTLGEGELGDIRSGAYAGVVVARGEVQHFSYWNVDWPVTTHACITGIIIDADGKAVRGATVTTRGVTYTGTSTPQTTGRDGRFCVEVMRSEGPGEDVDQDGIRGETQRVVLRISARGKVYDGGEYNIPASQASCGTTGCLDIGKIRLIKDRELKPVVCTLSGTVRSVDGTPVEGASVLAWDETVDAEVQFALCSELPQHFCQFFATTDAEGAFTITSVVLDGLFYYAYDNAEDETSSLLRWSQGNTRGCPSQPLEIILSEGFRNVTVTAAVGGGVISWMPAAYGATSVYVTGDTGFKWVVSATSSNIGTPVTYGTVPVGAEQTFPFDGSPPAPLSSGDTVQIFVSGTGSDGYPYSGIGTAVVP